MTGPTPAEVRQTERELLARGLDAVASECSLIAQGALFPVWYRFTTNRDQLAATADAVRAQDLSTEVGYAYLAAGRLAVREAADEVHASRASRRMAPGHLPPIETPAP